MSREMRSMEEVQAAESKALKEQQAIQKECGEFLLAELGVLRVELDRMEVRYKRALEQRIEQDKSILNSLAPSLSLEKAQEIYDEYAEIRGKLQGPDTKDNQLAMNFVKKMIAAYQEIELKYGYTRNELQALFRKMGYIPS